MAITLHNYIWPYWDKAQRYMGPAMCTTGRNPRPALATLRKLADT